MSWLKSVLEELDAISDAAILNPDSEIEQGDHVVGIAGLELRKLYMLFVQKHQKALESIAAALSLEGQKRASILRDAERFKAESTALRENFWASCRHDFPELWTKESIGIRIGWQVVWSEPKEASQELQPPPELMAALLKRAALESLMAAQSGEDPKEQESDEPKYWN